MMKNSAQPAACLLAQITPENAQGLNIGEYALGSIVDTVMVATESLGGTYPMVCLWCAPWQGYR